MPSEAEAELDRTPPGLLADILTMRAFVRVKQAYDAANARSDDKAGADLQKIVDTPYGGIIFDIESGRIE